MSDTSLLLSLPLIQPAQAQKHVTHNEAIARLDLLVQLAVEARDLAQAPPDAAPGLRHIVGPGASGAWAGREGDIALMTETGWQFTSPQPGWQAHVVSEAHTVAWTGQAWEPLVDPMPVVERLGVATTPDADNPLAVAGPATLLTHSGGSHRLKVNKASPTDTASLLFQTNWSGRAEMGLAGDDGFAVKVSADGSAFRTALQADPATGRVSVPEGLHVDGHVTGGAVMQHPGDGTEGRLMTVGAFGLGRAPGQGVALGSAASAPGGGMFALPPSADPLALSEDRALLVLPADTGAGLLSLAVGGASRPLFGAISPEGTVAWDAALTRATAVGTVAPEGGPAAPAILETGGDAGGRYLRLADGTQICWGQFSLGGVAVTIGFAGGFRSSGQNVAFVKPFAAAPALTTCCADLGASDALCGGSGSVGVAGFATYLWRATSSASARLVGNYIAIGRWM